jgi:hypothetical protein
MHRSSAYLLALLAGVSGVLAGCGHRVSYYRSPPVDGVRFHARALVDGARRDTLRVNVTAVNHTRHERRMEFGCPVAARLTAAGGSRAWDYAALEEQRRRTVRRDPVTGAPILYLGCAGALGVETLAPGDSSNRRFWLSVPVRDILGDSLQPGRYRVTARIGVNQRLFDHIDAGEVELLAPPT